MTDNQEEEEFGFDEGTAIAMMQNAIGYEIYFNDGREIVKNADGIETIELTAEESARARLAAIKAFRYLQEWLAEGAPPADVA